MYHMDAVQLARVIMQDALDTIGTISAYGIWPNLYLAKIALDIVLKRSSEFIGMLDEDL